MKTTNALVAKIWDHMTGKGIDITHTEIEEALKCATGESPCPESKTEDSTDLGFNF